MISGNQLMAAGCYLPLSENPFISKELGTRHRAAIGMTEVSDAVVVVVSEETGQISLSINGQVVRDIKEESLISKLFEELRPKHPHEEETILEKERAPVDRWLNNVNVVRVVAVLIGILLWLVIRFNYEQITPGGNQSRSSRRIRSSMRR